MQDALIGRVREAFARVHGVMPDGVFYAPGRVNLIGEHTDYNDGFVLPCAIGFGTAIAFSGNDAGRIDAAAADYDDGRDRFEIAPEIAHHGSLPWAEHVRGVVAAMQARGWRVPAARLVIAGDVPRDAGLSSSASLGVALGGVFRSLTKAAALGPAELALIAQAAENDFVGCACGIMDQLVSASAVAGHASLIDCRSLATTSVPVPPEAAIGVLHSGIRRGLVGSAYNERRRQCEAAAQGLGVRALRDVSLAVLEAARSRFDDVVYRRARHVVTENARTLAAADALRRGDFGAISALMAASHASMRDDFEITVPAIDQLVDQLTESPTLTR